MQMASLQGDFILPALKPPPGVTSHFVITGNPTKTAPILVAICVPIVTAFVWARMYTKIRVVKSHGWDD
ncbi:hypothetical protein MMC29_008096, partial [Sticta canariensis]|nr:hypothetical protein [Sticta canariensis]